MVRYSNMEDGMVEDKRCSKIMFDSIRFDSADIIEHRTSFKKIETNRSINQSWTSSTITLLVLLLLGVPVPISAWWSDLPTMPCFHYIICMENKDRTHKKKGRDQHILKSNTNIIRTSYTRNGENYYDIRNGDAAADADGRDSIWMPKNCVVMWYRVVLLEWTITTCTWSSSLDWWSCR